MTGDDLLRYLQNIPGGGYGQIALVFAAGAGWIFRRELWGWLKGLRKGQPVEPETVVVPVEDATALELVQTLRVVTCLEPPTIREGIAKHLDAIDSLLGGNPESDTEVDPA